MARFKVRNPRAERWLADSSSSLITEITESTQDAVRFLLRDAMTKGRGPRSVALDIVGRIDTRTGVRTGGIVGLHSQDVASANRALAQLRSGDPAEMAKYLRRKARNRNFDSVVRKAIREGRAVPAEQAGKIVSAYQNRLLYQRGETIARTELLQSLHHAQDEAIEQLVESEKLERRQISAEWDASEDGHTRDSHAAANGQRVEGEQTFTVGGYQMRFPGDRSGGAPAKEVINCRCRKRIHIDHIASLGPGD